MFKKEPAVSIIIPTYNRYSFLGMTLKSVLLQSYANWECIVIDDGSFDQTEVLVKRYALTDKRFRYIKRPRSVCKGASSCRNIGLEICQGDYMLFLDSDDLIPPNKLEAQLDSLKLFGNGVLAGSGWTLFKTDIKKGIFAKLPFQNNMLYSGCMFLNIMGETDSFCPLHTYLIPKLLIEKAGKWDESLSNNDDAEFMTRILLTSDGVIYSEEPRVYYRKFGKGHLSNFSRPDRVMSAIDSWNKIEQHLKEAGCDNLIYVRNAKKGLFQTLKNKFPITLARNKIFFEKEFKEEHFRLSPYYIFRKSCRNVLSDIRTIIKSQFKGWMIFLFIW